MKLIKKVLLTSCLVIGLISSNAMAKKMTIKTPIAFNKKLIGLGTTIDYVSKRVNVATDGEIKLKVYDPNKLVAPFEILDAVSTGKVGAGYATAGYWAGKIPASPIFSAVPFGPEAPEYIAWFYYGNGMKLYQEMYDNAGFNVKVHLCGVIAPETSGWFSRPIEGPEDLKGLKMRFFGLGGQVMQKLGVSTTLLPGGEIFPALEKGAIDATEFSMPAIDKRLGFYKVAKYNYFPGWHQQATAFELLINKDVWSKMSKGQQMIISMACKDATANAIAEGEAAQFEIMKQNVEKRGVKMVRWSDEMLDLFKTTWEEVAAEQASKDAFFKKVYQDLETFRKGYDLWESNAFLPRNKS